MFKVKTHERFCHLPFPIVGDVGGWVGGGDCCQGDVHLIGEYCDKYTPRIMQKEDKDSAKGKHTKTIAPPLPPRSIQETGYSDTGDLEAFRND